jgi:hypothetical protein
MYIQYVPIVKRRGFCDYYVLDNNVGEVETHRVNKPLRTAGEGRVILRFKGVTHP